MITKIEDSRSYGNVELLWTTEPTRSIFPTSPHPPGGTNPVTTLEGISPFLVKVSLNLIFFYLPLSSLLFPAHISFSLTPADKQLYSFLRQNISVERDTEPKDRSREGKGKEISREEQRRGQMATR